jgi:hypothetical protein
LILNFFKFLKYLMEELKVSYVLLPHRETLVIIIEIAYFQWILLSLNLIWFLTN